MTWTAQCVRLVVGACLCLYPGQGFTPSSPHPSSIPRGKQGASPHHLATSDHRFRESTTRQQWSSSGGILEAPTPRTLRVPPETATFIATFITPESKQSKAGPRRAATKKRSPAAPVKLSLKAKAAAAAEQVAQSRVRAVQRASAAIKVQRQLAVQFRRSPTPSELASALGVSEDTLITMLEQGAKARAGLVQAFEGMVHNLLKRFRGVLTSSEMQDLQDEAYLGIIQAASRYKPSKGKFSTYAYYYINKRIMETAESYSRIAVRGRSDNDALKELRRAEEEMAQESSDAPTPSEMADKLQWSVERVLDLQRRSQPVVSAERAVFGNVRVMDTLVDHSITRPQVALRLAEHDAAVQRSLSKLPPEERTVLAYRLGLVDGVERSWEDLLGLMDGCTVSYLRKVEMRAKTHLLRDVEFNRLFRGNSGAGQLPVIFELAYA